MDLGWAPNPNDGLPATFYTLSYGVTPTADDTTTVLGFSDTLTGLLPATTYYFKVRGTNAVGTGPYSEISNFTTVAGGYILDSGLQKKAIPYVRDAGVWKLAEPWEKNGDVWGRTIN
jgi:hypothetical protein